MPVDEQDVAGEDHAIIGNIGQHVAVRMRGSDLDEAHRLVADAPLELAFEGHGRHRDVLDAGEIERREDFRQKDPGLGRFVDPGLIFGQPARIAQPVIHLLGAGTRGDDLRTLHQPVTEGVIAVGMSVDQGADARGSGLRPAHRVEHLLRQRQVEQRIDQHRLAAVGDQARVAPSPGAVGLKVGVTAVAEIVQALAVGPFARNLGHGRLPLGVESVRSLSSMIRRRCAKVRRALRRRVRSRYGERAARPPTQMASTST